MPRIRTVKPEHWSDKQLSEITLPAHLFWIGTWNFSDDEGVFEEVVVERTQELGGEKRPELTVAQEPVKHGGA